MSLDPNEPGSTKQQRTELGCRLDEDETSPDDVAPWEGVKARALARMRDRGANSARPSEPDDDLANDLIKNNPKFRSLLERSLASGREPFPFADPKD
jgi:hypothetical protein